MLHLSLQYRKILTIFNYHYYYSTNSMNNIITAIASIETKNTNNAEFQVQIFPDLKLFHDTGDGK